MDKLRHFNGDVELKNQLLNFIHEYINTTALERMYRKEDVTHIGDAKELIDGAFDLLQETYKVSIKQDAPTLQAR